MSESQPQTQGKTEKDSNNNTQTNTTTKELLRRDTKAGALSVLSYTPIARITYKHPDFNLMFASIAKGLNYSPL